MRTPRQVQKLTLRGELRLRYEYDDLGAQANGTRDPRTGSADNPEAQTSRNRFQLKLYADYELNENFLAGVARQRELGHRPCG